MVKISVTYYTTFPKYLKVRSLVTWVHFQVFHETKLFEGQEVTDQWYSEVKMYTFGVEPTSLQSGMYSRSARPQILKLSWRLIMK